MSLFSAILAAILAAFDAFRREREMYNSPEMVKNKLAEQNQAAKDAINRADAVLADPTASAAAHKQALDELRRAMS